MAEQTRGDGSRAAVMASSPRQPAAEQGDRSSPSAGGRDQAAITRASFAAAAACCGSRRDPGVDRGSLPGVEPCSPASASELPRDANGRGPRWKGAQFDAVLGWVPIPNHSGRAGLTADYHTLDHGGARRNRSDQTTLATGGAGRRIILCGRRSGQRRRVVARAVGTPGSACR
jgi:hypothetical protein